MELCKVHPIKSSSLIWDSLTLVSKSYLWAMQDVLSEYVNLSQWNKGSFIIHLSRRAVSISITVTVKIFKHALDDYLRPLGKVPLLPWTLVKVFLHIDSIDVYCRVWRETLSWDVWAFKGSWWFKGCDDQGCSFLIHNPVKLKKSLNLTIWCTWKSNHVMEPNSFMFHFTM